jgi:UDP-N-acetylenolpyruvoylglucosamine reductase
MSMIHESISIDPNELRARVVGDVHTPSDAGWDEARMAWNLAADQRPAVVLLAGSADDVAAAVDFARAAGLRVAAQSTGHAAAARRWDEPTLLIKMERLRGVRIDSATRIARAEAGAQWQDVTSAAAEHGLAALAGSSPDVGVVGYTLGGGLSWLARRHGIAANSVVAIELVTADGRPVRVDADTMPDLFWALRGGGGSFGVVTAIEFRLYPLAEIYAGALFFPLERASEVLHAWREWIETVPEEVTSVGRVMQFPPLPDIPEPLRGNAFALIEAAIIGDDEHGATLIEPLRALGAAIDTFATIPAAALNRLHMDPEHPVPGTGDGMLLSDFPSEAIDALVELVGSGSRSPLLSAEVRHLGGAVGRIHPGGGALASIDSQFAFFGVGIAMNPEMKAAVSAHVDRVKQALSPWAGAGHYLNFLESQVDAGEIYPETTHRRLRQIKARYDSGDLFLSNHPIAPAA